MTDTNAQNTDFSEASRIGARVVGLRQRIDERTDSKRKKQNLILIVGTSLLLLCTFALTRLTIQGRQLDAEGLTQIGRLELEQRLPDTVRVLEAKLEEDAPKLVQDGMNRMIAVLPELRMQLVNNLNERIDELNTSFQDKLKVVMQQTVKKTKRELDAAFPNKSDREKLEMLVARVAVKFKENFADILTVLYPKYSAEMRRVKSELLKLKQKRPADLTRSERLKKEIIETMVELAHRTRSGLN